MEKIETKNIDKNIDKPSKKNFKWYFLFGVMIIYFLTYFISYDRLVLTTKFFANLILKILPIFAFVYLFMVAINYFIRKDLLIKYMGEESGIKGWLIAIGTGILSVGPIYMWYPLMKDMQKKGIKNKFLAAFLYNRGIKLQWVPILVAYFGWTYSLTLLIVMAALSIPQGIITEKLIGHSQED